MFVRIRAVSWEVVGFVIGLLVNLWFILEKVFQNRKLLLKGVKLGVRVAKLSAIKFSGLTIVFLSSVVLGVLPIASYLFVQAGMNVPSQIPVLTFAAAIASLLYGFVGLVGLGTGLWLIAPKHSVGRFGRNLVVVHIFRRRKGKARTGHNVPTSTCFGLIHRLAPKLQ